MLASKIDVNIEKPILQKALKHKHKFSVFFVSFWCRNLHPKSIKNQKLKLKMDRLLASIFGGFWWILGAKLGEKIEPKAIKNRLKSASKNDEKRCALEAPGGGDSTGGPRARVDPGTP